MLTKNEIKHIRQLQQKKFRQLHAQFIAEGTKLVGELLQSEHKIHAVYCTADIQEQFPQAELVSTTAMAQMSTLATPPGVLAVAAIPDLPAFSPAGGWVLALNDINDPGNLGTIVRTADWFGIDTVLCSENSVDAYNPKVVQASMGAIFRMKVHYGQLPVLLNACRKAQMPVFAADMQGQSLQEVEFPQSGVLLMGSESHGISVELKPLVNHWVHIAGKGKTESLNVSVAAAIICSRLPL